LQDSSKSIQSSQNWFLTFLKSSQILNYLLNTQAVANLLIPDLKLPPQSYELIRIISSMVYKKVPSWETRTYDYLYHKD
jgi:hypothetical protein